MSEPLPVEGSIVGPADFGVRTVYEDAIFDETGLTATRGAIDLVMDEPDSDMDDMRRRPTWMPETG